MALQNKLKAFVRFDGSGRVIPSSLILQKSKPKVGNWKEINATQCCDAAPTTTTTTTVDPRPRISTLACGPLLPYQEITIVNGSSICDPMIYITGDFSQLPQGPFYVNVGSTYRMFGAMGNQAYPSGPCASCGGGTTTTTTTASAFMFNVNLASSSQSACAGMPAWNLYAATPFLGNGTTLYYTSQLDWAYDGAYGSYLNYQNVVYTLSGATIANNGTSCSSITTTTTTTQALFPVEVYVQGGSSNSNLCPEGSTGSSTQYMYCTTPTLQAGSILYQNGQIVGAGGFWYKQVGYNTVWSPMYNDGVLYQGCLNSGTLTGKITNDSSTPCNGAGTDISFTVSTGLQLGLSSSSVIAADGFSFFGAGFTSQQVVRILQTGTNVWFNYVVLNDVVAVPQDAGAYTPYTCPTTTTTTTTASLFSGTVYISDSRAASCETGVAQYSKSVTGNGTTFCNSTEFSGSLENVLSGSYYVSFGGNGGSIPSTNVVIATFNGTGVAVVTEICSSC